MNPHSAKDSVRLFKLCPVGELLLSIPPEEQLDPVPVVKKKTNTGDVVGKIDGVLLRRLVSAHPISPSGTPFT